MPINLRIDHLVDRALAGTEAYQRGQEAIEGTNVLGVNQRIQAQKQFIS